MTTHHPNRELFEKYKKLYKQGNTQREIASRLRLYPWGVVRLHSDMIEERIFGDFSSYTKGDKYFPISYSY